MAIRMILECDREAGDISCPEVFCDWCGRQITDGSRGLYLWEAGKSGRPVNGLVRFVHKGTCDDLFCDSHGGKAAWFCMELKDFPTYLARNLKLPKAGMRR